MKRNIFIIEKNEAVRYLLATVLQKRFRIYSFKNCFEAGSVLKKIKPEVIVVDLYSKNADNVDFIMHIKSSSLHSSIPVIALLNDNNPELIATCLERSIEYYFRKPFDPAILKKKIEELTEVPVSVYMQIDGYGSRQVQLAGNL